MKMLASLTNSKNAEYCNPLTSFDWSDVNPNMIGTSSIDKTCTIWDVPTATPVVQLIAHDKEVFDISFAPTKNKVASVGADGSLRLFDLSSLEHSTILYETPNLAPILRLRWNQVDPNYLACISADGIDTVILDIRYSRTVIFILPFLVTSAKSIYVALTYASSPHCVLECQVSLL